MLKKIILPLVILIFAHEELYGMKEEKKEETNENSDIEEQFIFWNQVDNYMNKDKLWLLWVIIDNVPFQYGGSKIWKHEEAYYGLSNGIGFFPSFLNFGWLKIGIVDAHINVINTIIKYMKTYTHIKYDYYYMLKGCHLQHKNPVWLNSLKWWLFYTVVTDIHLFSFKFFNCVKIKIISIGAVVSKIFSNKITYDDWNDNGIPPWYFSFFFSAWEYLQLYKYYFILSPRIELNIAGIIDYFKKS